MPSIAWLSYDVVSPSLVKASIHCLVSPVIDESQSPATFRLIHNVNTITNRKRPQRAETGSEGILSRNESASKIFTSAPTPIVRRKALPARLPASTEIRTPSIYLRSWRECRGNSLTGLFDSAGNNAAPLRLCLWLFSWPQSSKILNLVWGFFAGADHQRRSIQDLLLPVDQPIGTRNPSCQVILLLALFWLQLNTLQYITINR